MKQIFRNLLWAAALFLSVENARAFYNPTTGRWLSRDPVGEQGGLNVTGFVENNPVSGVDALGLWNYWNPATWGVANGAGWSVADSFNPFHESASWDGYSADYFRQSVASATGFKFLGDYDQCDKTLASTRMLGRASTLALEIFGPMKLARWAESGAGLWRAGTSLGLNSYGLYQSAAAVGSGAGKLSAGDPWGAVELGLGLLGVKPGVSGVMSGGRRFAAEARGLASAGSGTATGPMRFAINPGRQKRTIDEARALANKYGVEIPSDIELIPRKMAQMVMTSSGYARASYVQLGQARTARWSDFYANGKIPVQIRESILRSDEAIVATLAHEMYELNQLRSLFATAKGGTMPNDRISRLISEPYGHLHEEALRIEEQILRRMRGLK